MLGWFAFFAAIMAATGGIMNALSIADRERPGDLANNPYGWAGAKFWRLGLLGLAIVGLMALVSAIT